jgi:hypothetical protein
VQRQEFGRLQHVLCLQACCSLATRGCTPGSSDIKSIKAKNACRSPVNVQRHHRARRPAIERSPRTSARTPIRIPFGPPGFPDFPGWNHVVRNGSRAGLVLLRPCNRRGAVRPIASAEKTLAFPHLSTFCHCFPKCLGLSRQPHPVRGGGPDYRTAQVETGYVCRC